MSIQWRLYEPKDSEAVLELHAQLEERVGRKLPLPNLMSDPVLVALVGEIDGKVTHGVFLELEAEVCAIGPNAMAPSEMPEAVAYLESVLDRFKIRIVRAFVPRQMVATRNTAVRGRIINKKPALKRLLEKLGFVQEDDSRISQFYRWIQPADGDPAEAVHSCPGSTENNIGA